MAVRDEILYNELQISRVQHCPPLQNCGETDTSHTLAGVQDGPSPMEKGVGITRQITYSLPLDTAILLLGIY